VFLVYVFVFLLEPHGFMRTGVISPLQHPYSSAFERPVPPAHTFNPPQPIGKSCSDG